MFKRIVYPMCLWYLDHIHIYNASRRPLALKRSIHALEVELIFWPYVGELNSFCFFKIHLIQILS